MFNVKNMFNKKAFRLILGIIIVIILLFAIVPYLFRFQSLDGVVNGRLTIIRSPINGKMFVTTQKVFALL